MILFFLQCCWLMLPMGVANMSPEIFKSRLKALNLPIDFNKKFYGQPLFGSHKTWRGLSIGIVAGGLTFIVQQMLYSLPSFQGLYLFDFIAIPSHFGFVLGFGALFGDLVRAFFKRRFGIKSGERWVPFDQVDFVLGGIVVIMLYHKINIQTGVCLLTLGFLFHIILCHIGYYLNIKKSRW